MSDPVHLAAVIVFTKYTHDTVANALPVCPFLFGQRQMHVCPTLQNTAFTYGTDYNTLLLLSTSCVCADFQKSSPRKFIFDKWVYLQII